MEQVKINVCVRPYYHDVVDTITRKPKFDAKKQKHFVTYKKGSYELVSERNIYLIWIDEE